MSVKIILVVFIGVILLTHTAIPGSFNDELIMSSKNGDLQPMTILISKSAKINEKDAYGSTPLIYAVE